jgi:enolase
MAIKNILLREILDSRGNPTIEAEISSERYTAVAAAPSGASVGAHEVPAFPKGGPKAAISAFKTTFEAEVAKCNVSYHEIDERIHDLDTERKILGGNLSIAVSLAIAKLQAMEAGVKFYDLFAAEIALPFPLGNVIGGGVHAGKGSPEIQEFLAIPIGAPTFKDAALANARVHKLAGEAIKAKNPEFTRGRGDEGAWAPMVSNEEALQMVFNACQQASSELGFEIRPGMDVAASEFWDKTKEKYVYKEGERNLEEQVHFLAGLVNDYNVFYIEDGFHEDDFQAFSLLNQQVGGKCLVVGDDLTTTNPERLNQAIKLNAVNSLIVKPNQIGSLSETEAVLNLAKSNNIKPVVSHRSGETTDTSISHLAVGFSAPIIKTGVLGGERIAKLNELIRIEEREKGRAKMAKL